MTNNIPNHVTIKKLKNLGCHVKINHFRFFENKGSPHSKKEINCENLGIFKWRNVLPRGGETIVEIQLPNDEIIEKYALCSKKDNFNKKIGLEIALDRALNSVISDDGTLLSDFVASKTTDIETTSGVAKI